MTQPQHYPDGEGGAREWARGEQLAGGLVFFGKPKGARLPRLWLEIQLIDAPPEDEIGSVGDYELQWDAYARTSKEDAWTLIEALESAIKQLHTGSPFGEKAVVIGTEITLGPLWRPEKDTDIARYLLGTRIKLAPSALAA